MYKQILDKARDGILVINPQAGKIVEANQAMQRLSGYTRDELLTINPFDLSAEPEDTKKVLQNALFKEGDMIVERHLKRKDGSIVPVEISARTIHYEAHKMVIGIFRDITDRKQAERDKLALIQKLEKALSEVKQLSGLLPICSRCKKIRDEKQSWRHLEDYIQEHSEALFSHSICPDCARRLYQGEEWFDL